jgi:hypothetical protein
VRQQRNEPVPAGMNVMSKSKEKRRLWRADEKNNLMKRRRRGRRRGNKNCESILNEGTN